MSGQSLLGMGLVVAAAIFGGVLGLTRGSSTPTGLEVSVEASHPADDSDPPAETRIWVHVGGWVAHPTVVVLPGDALVADAVRAAGGALPGANLDAVNLAQRLDDGAHVIVPGPEVGSVGAGETGHASDGRVRLNSATAAEIEALPGVGPVLAGRIVAYREEHGPFRSVEDLLDVSGIGESKLAALRDLVIIQ